METAPRVDAGLRTVISVIIPAHNEESVLGRCLRALLGEQASQELEIIVVANGCTDATAEVARDFGGQVRVVSTDIASKSHALNLGDGLARGFPRLYVDADVELPAASVREICSTLERGPYQAAAPTARFDFSGCSWGVRAYYRFWRALPFARGAIAGGGVYGLSAAGRQRFGSFPDLVADDLFVRELFGDDERIALGCEVIVRPPRNVRSLVRVRARILAGNRDYRRGQRGSPPREQRRSRVRSVLPHPGLWPAGLVYVGVYAAAQLRSRRPASPGWARDETARLQP